MNPLLRRQPPKPRAAGQRIGLYGGSFDPVHLGHLIGAQDALEQLQLDEVIFIPCAQSPHKRQRPLAADPNRLQMLRLSIKGNDRFSVCDWELGRPGPSFAIETVREFRGQRPGTTFFWLIGLDQVPLLSTWKDFEVLRNAVTFLVMARPGVVRARPRRGLMYLPQPRAIAISSTEIRWRVKNQLPIQHLVPTAVARYITRNHLYR